MTHLLKLLDLTLNSWAKNFMREKFAEWYASQIREGLNSGKDLEDFEVKIPSSIMKPMDYPAL